MNKTPTVAHADNLYCINKSSRWEEFYGTGSTVAICAWSSFMLMSISSASKVTYLLPAPAPFTNALEYDGCFFPALSAVVSFASTTTSRCAAAAARRPARQCFSAATMDVAAAPTILTITLICSRSRGMSESGQRRDASSCAALRRIGSRKVPLDARSSETSPCGVVDVAAAKSGDSALC